MRETLQQHREDLEGDPRNRSQLDSTPRSIQLLRGSNHQDQDIKGESQYHLALPCLMNQLQGILKHDLFHQSQSPRPTQSSLFSWKAIATYADLL